MQRSRRQLLALGSVGCLLVLLALIVGRPVATNASRPSQISATTDSAVALSRGGSLGPAHRAPQAYTPIFDAITNATSFSFAPASHTYMGQPFNLASASPITAIRIQLASLAAVNYSDLEVRVQVWDTFNGATNPVFSSPAGPVYTFNLGSANLALNTLYDITLPLTTPIALTGTDNHGITINFRGDTGSGMQDTTNLTTAIRGGTGAPAFAAGSVPLSAPNYGYYRNVNGRTDFNFDLGDSRQIGVNSALAIALFTGAPDPTATAIASVTTTPPTATVTTTATVTATATLPTTTVTATATLPTTTVTATATLPTTTVIVTPTTTTATATVTATATATANPSATATAIVGQRRLYLPLIIR